MSSAACDLTEQVASSSNSSSSKNVKKALKVLQRQKLCVSFNLDQTPYQALENIGTGAYGVVCSAQDKNLGTKVAIKKIPHAFTNPTVAKRTLREIKVLLHFDHENIISIKDMFHRDGQFGSDVYIVLDLMETDLHQIIHSKQPLTNQHVQYFLYQILRGVKYIHSANIIHRDLKPSNLMVNSDCLLKIGDFGMARSLASPSPSSPSFMTQYVATRWYRAPELLFSLLDYSTSVDIWSIGCIFAEMIQRRQLFPGKDHLSQLKLIVYYLGTPPPSVLEKISSDIIRRIISSIGVKTPLPWSTYVPRATPNALDLLGRMMRMAPWERVTAEEALKHVFLEEYHDPPFEPRCEREFTFDRDIDALARESLQEEILLAIESVHGTKNKPPGSTSVQLAEKIPTDLSAQVHSSISHAKKTSDVEMLSAKFEEVSVLEPPAMDSKAKLRAILEAKAAAGSSSTSSVTTAQTRHLERSEKRRRKAEKARMREQREAPRMSEQDQSLLQRWSKMQEQKQQEAVPIDDYFGGDASVAPAVFMPYGTFGERVVTEGFYVQPQQYTQQPEQQQQQQGLFSEDLILYREPPVHAKNEASFESQLGDIISQTLPSAGSEDVCFRSADAHAMPTSAQLMEDWIAAVRAAECKPEDISRLEREIRRDLV